VSAVDAAGRGVAAARCGMLAAFALATAAGCGSARPEVVARDRDGGVVAEAALPPDGRFALSYRHSVYKASAVERFRATGDGFVLESVASPSAEVIDYYALDGRRTREHGWWVMTPDRPARFGTMALAGTRLGRRTLVAGPQHLPLYRSDGRAVHLRLAVEGT
jgi:Domain of unknown function (DUF1850)